MIDSDGARLQQASVASKRYYSANVRPTKNLPIRGTNVPLSLTHQHRSFYTQYASLSYKELTEAYLYGGDLGASGCGESSKVVKMLRCSARCRWDVDSIPSIRSRSFSA